MTKMPTLTLTPTHSLFSVLLTQMENTTARNAALMTILRSLMGEPLFAELRTKKQLGYIVSLSTSGYGRYVMP